jgi:hypothetical protein
LVEFIVGDSGRTNLKYLFYDLVHFFGTKKTKNTISGKGSFSVWGGMPFNLDQSLDRPEEYPVAGVRNLKELLQSQKASELFDFFSKNVG